MHFFRDSGISSVLESSFTPRKLRLSGRCFFALTKKITIFRGALKQKYSLEAFNGNIFISVGALETTSSKSTYQNMVGGAQ